MLNARDETSRLIGLHESSQGLEAIAIRRVGSRTHQSLDAGERLVVVLLRSDRLDLHSNPFNRAHYAAWCNGARMISSSYGAVIRPAASRSRRCLASNSETSVWTFL